MLLTQITTFSEAGRICFDISYNPGLFYLQPISAGWLSVEASSRKLIERISLFESCLGLHVVCRLLWPRHTCTDFPEGEQVKHVREWVVGSVESCHLLQEGRVQFCRLPCSYPVSVISNLTLLKSFLTCLKLHLVLPTLLLPPLTSTGSFDPYTKTCHAGHLH